MNDFFSRLAQTAVMQQPKLTLQLPFHPSFLEGEAITDNLEQLQSDQHEPKNNNNLSSVLAQTPITTALSPATKTVEIKKIVHSVNNYNVAPTPGPLISNAEVNGKVNLQPKIIPKHDVAFKATDKKNPVAELSETMQQNNQPSATIINTINTVKTVKAAPLLTPKKSQLSTMDYKAAPFSQNKNASPKVEVRIGRLEIRAAKPPATVVRPPQAKSSAPQTGPTLSLRSYLRL